MKRAQYLINGVRLLKQWNLFSCGKLCYLRSLTNACLKNIVVYLNGQKVSTLSRAAVLADEFALMDKNVFSPHLCPVMGQFYVIDKNHPGVPGSSFLLISLSFVKGHESGHLIADCLLLKKKEQIKRERDPHHRHSR